MNTYTVKANAKRATMLQIQKDRGLNQKQARKWFSDNYEMKGTKGDWFCGPKEGSEAALLNSAAEVEPEVVEPEELEVVETVVENDHEEQREIETENGEELQSDGSEVENSIEADLKPELESVEVEPEPEQEVEPEVEPEPEVEWHEEQTGEVKVEMDAPTDPEPELGEAPVTEIEVEETEIDGNASTSLFGDHTGGESDSIEPEPIPEPKVELEEIEMWDGKQPETQEDNSGVSLEAHATAVDTQPVEEICAELGQDTQAEIAAKEPVEELKVEVSVEATGKEVADAVAKTFNLDNDCRREVEFNETGDTIDPAAKKEPESEPSDEVKLYGTDTCPNCDIHLSNGVHQHDPKQGKDHVHVKLEFGCLGCGKEFGKSITKRRQGSVKQVWEICEANKDKGLARKDVVELCVQAGINKFTARTQYQAWFKATKESAAEENTSK